MFDQQLKSYFNKISPNCKLKNFGKCSKKKDKLKLCVYDANCIMVWEKFVEFLEGGNYETRDHTKI